MIILILNYNEGIIIKGNDMSSTQLNNHFEEISKLSSLATTHEDILDISNKIRTFNAEHGYSYQQPYILSFLLLSIAISLVSFLSENQNVLIYSIVSSVIFACVFMFRGGKKKGVVNQLVFKSVEIKNKLVSQTFDGRELWRELSKKFPIFNCGDESQEITQLFSSSTNDGIEFQLYEFKYVDVEEVEEEDSDGNKTTKEERTTYYVAGVITEIKDFQGITINSGRFKTKWNSASKNFNKRFKVKCDNEISAAKFFTPSTVLTFEDSYKDLLSLDVTEEGEICMSFNRQILPSTIKVKSIKKSIKQRTFFDKYRRCG